MPHIRWWRTLLGPDETARVVAAIGNGHVSQGPLTVELETEAARQLEVPFAVATTSGSVAIMLALWANGLRAGDEVILPNRTFAASAHAVLMLGGRVALVDTVPGRPVIDVDRIEARITPRTRAIMPVELNGRAPDLAAIRRIAERHGLKVIEDSAQAMFSRNAEGYLGTRSDAGAFSLGMTKFLQSGQGGLVVTRDAGVCERLKLLRNHGVGGDAFGVNYRELGFNFKFTDLQAALVLPQLARAAERVQRLLTIYGTYRSGLDGCGSVRLLPVDVEAGEVPIYIEALCPDRACLMAYLAEHGVDTRPSLPSLHRSPHLEPSGEFPNSALFEEQALFLPSGPAQTDEDIARVIELIRAHRG